LPYFVRRPMVDQETNCNAGKVVCDLPDIKWGRKIFYRTYPGKLEVSLPGFKSNAGRDHFAWFDRRRVGALLVFTQIENG